MQRVRHGLFPERLLAPGRGREALQGVQAPPLLLKRGHKGPRKPSCHMGANLTVETEGSLNHVQIDGHNKVSLQRAGQDR